jgi:hypothetical protein
LRTLFIYEQEQFTRADVLLAAIHRGDWQPFAQSLCRAMAVEAAADSTLTDDALRPGVIAFRRARGLLSGEEYRTWLNERGLTTDDVTAHVRRALVGPGTPAAVGDGSPAVAAAVDADVAATAGVELQLGGQLLAWAERLARCAAAERSLTTDGAPAPVAPDEQIATLVVAARDSAAPDLDQLGPDDLTSRARRVVELETAFTQFAARAATATRLDGCLVAHRLDWQLLRWEQATFSSQGAALEAALGVRADGVALAQITQRAGGAWSEEHAYANSADGLAAALLGAEPGELVGPLGEDDRWLLLALRERVAPATDDPVLAARAREEVLEDALARHLAGRVEWNGDV